jgi:hypothetical protein
MAKRLVEVYRTSTKMRVASEAYDKDESLQVMVTLPHPCTAEIARGFGGCKPFGIPPLLSSLSFENAHDAVLFASLPRIHHPPSVLHRSNDVFPIYPATVP